MALVAIFRLFGQLPRLTKFAVSNALDACTAADQMLMQDTFYKRVMAACFRGLIGRDFFALSMSATLSDICTFDLMLDVSRAELGTEPAVIERLFGKAQMLLDSLVEQAVQLPQEARDALLLLRASSHKRFGVTDYPLIEKFMF